MTTKERLLEAIETTPEPILALVLAFLEFLRGRLATPSSEGSQTDLAALGTVTAEASSNRSTAANAHEHPMLRYAGRWAGDDLQDCLDEVRASRGKAQF